MTLTGVGGGRGRGEGEHDGERERDGEDGWVGGWEWQLTTTEPVLAAEHDDSATSLW